MLLDVYPESLSQRERISAHSLLFRILRALDRRIAHSAKALIVISDQFRETYRLDRGVPAERIHVLQNWGETTQVNVDARGGGGGRQKIRHPRSNDAGGLCEQHSARRQESRR